MGLSHIVYISQKCVRHFETNNAETHLKSWMFRSCPAFQVWTAYYHACVADVNDYTLNCQNTQHKCLANVQMCESPIIMIMTLNHMEENSIMSA